MVMKKFFWALQQIKFTQKKFHVNWIISFENIDGVYPPPQKTPIIEGGVRLIFDLINIHLGMNAIFGPGQFTTENWRQDDSNLQVL